MILIHWIHLETYSSHSLHGTNRASLVNTAQQNSTVRQGIQNIRESCVRRRSHVPIHSWSGDGPGGGGGGVWGAHCKYSRVDVTLGLSAERRR